MDCSIISACASPATGAAGGASAVDSAQSRRFAELVASEPLQDHVYVQGPVAEPAAQPVLDMMRQFQSLDLTPPETAPGSDAAAEPAGEPESEFSRTAHEALVAQAGILRTMMMMEVMNTTKQGVTTLFQQQG
ncbi:hypothetical protein [Piscinibacter terrae]|uniref:Uncharacterized protein n=1 Tax=Piscinibacter terrae TaxID=2496871 RepID=A0A3N7HH27_9BURK|nr:hypothetical protein [Albitalea terrae]RQP21320.1 hypothetical protein DZC73_27870 [Albitalea terrae]